MSTRHRGIGASRDAFRPSAVVRLLCCVVAASGSLAACSSQHGDEAVEGTTATSETLTASLIWDRPFSSVAGFLVLSGNLVVVSDSREQRVALLDLEAGTETSVAGLGGGPREFRVPGRVLPFGTGSFLLEDKGGRRFLLVSSDGQVKAVFNEPRQLVGALLIAGDERGGLYYQGSSATLSLDSVPVVRWHVEDTKLDTLFNVLNPAAASHQLESTSAIAQRLTMEVVQPFSPADSWLARRDGRVIVARVGSRRIEVWEDEALRQRGPTLRFRRIAITDVDRATYAQAPGSPSLSWPEVKPPFAHNALVPPGDSVIWLLESSEGGADMREYLVLTADGAYQRRIAVPRAVRVLWATPSRVFVARVDVNDLWWLEAHEIVGS